MKLYTTFYMAKKKTSHKELKPIIEDKKEIAISIPDTDTKEIGTLIINNKRGKLV